MGSALVLDGMWNKSLAAVRSLGRRGLHVAAGERTRLATALFSRYCGRRVVYPSVEEKTEEFLDWLEAEVRGHEYEVLFPMELGTQLAVTKNRKRFEKHIRIPFADPGPTSDLHDKACLMEYARRKGFETPRTYIPCALSDVKAIAEEIEFPVLVKPRRSSGSRGILHVEKKDGLLPACIRIHGRYGLPIIQEQIPPGGDAIGACVLLNFKSEVRASFVYKKLREYPVSGGPSTLRVSVVRDDVKEAAESLLKSVGWTGVAHVEFKVDPRDGRPRLLEVNPRFWGSLQLAVESGVDFPYLLYRMAVDGDVAPVSEYRAGVMCRWLIPGDILHYISNPGRSRLRPGFFSMGARDDVLSLADPMPTIGRISSAFTFLFDRQMRGILQTRG